MRTFGAIRNQRSSRRSLIRRNREESRDLYHSPTSHQQVLTRPLFDALVSLVLTPSLPYHVPFSDRLCSHTTARTRQFLDHDCD
ncbi:uncharacterized protein MYCGRDRAFT_106562 [Zymoseptoria tritici IPO323]|uniref:Uncharacterized protein n=1 Tax=Zymoseptoria tritici (strain CBS 115943 / IPO323) TaxID=336722 RepID=F9XQF0_ZYMTI|nr:uncharacterized protein MYCGRDRAFT_106562 [Zymoseptoria tritici IPO323]EGP82630.1 hypothetical protein MYCGRDRAFT_106562 [Zymoseptoria tritici IPO323]